MTLDFRTYAGRQTPKGRVERWRTSSDRAHRRRFLWAMRKYYPLLGKIEGHEIADYIGQEVRRAMRRRP